MLKNSTIKNFEMPLNGLMMKHRNDKVKEGKPAKKCAEDFGPTIKRTAIMPDQFNGRMDKFAVWRVQFEAFCGAHMYMYMLTHSTLHYHNTSAIYLDNPHEPMDESEGQDKLHRGKQFYLPIYQKSNCKRSCKEFDT